MHDFSTDCLCLEDVDVVVMCVDEQFVEEEKSVPGKTLFKCGSVPLQLFSSFFTY